MIQDMFRSRSKKDESKEDGSKDGSKESRSKEKDPLRKKRSKDYKSKEDTPSKRGSKSGKGRRTSKDKKKKRDGSKDGEKENTPVVEGSPRIERATMGKIKRAPKAAPVFDATDPEARALAEMVDWTPNYTPNELNIPINTNLRAARKYFRHNGMQANDFDYLETVGKGTFGNVMMVKLKQKQLDRVYSKGCPKLPPLAIKAMKKAAILQMDQVAHIRAEVDVLASVDHPFIISLYGVTQDATRLFLLMEYIRGGEVFGLLSMQDHFSLDQSRYYTAQVVLAFEYLHNRKIAYRDLKPENLLLDSNGNIKVADFGFAKIIGERTWTICGTPEYIAPEVLMSKGHGCAVDWWGLGILIFEMLTGAPPFNHENTMILYRMIQETAPKFPKFMDEPTKALISGLLTRDLSKRLGVTNGGAQVIRRHKFFKGLNWQDMIDLKIVAPWKPESTENELDSRYFEPYADSTEAPESITKTEQVRWFDSFTDW